jgi:DUF2975 family protein
MQTLRPDRVVRALTTLVSIAYFGLWLGAAIVLVAVPVAKLFGGPDADFHFGLAVPLTAHNSAAIVETGWGPAPLKLDDVQGELELSISRLPWSFVAVLWMYAGAGFGLTLLFGHNLRRICQRVRDGAPFDAQNALRLRTLGVLLFALALLNGIAEFVTSMAVRKGLTAGGPIGVPGGLHFDMTLIPFALGLIALAEIFRRGAELEHEQSLVV